MSKCSHTPNTTDLIATQMPRPKYTSIGILAQLRVTKAVNWPKQARLSWKTAPRVV